MSFLFYGLEIPTVVLFIILAGLKYFRLLINSLAYFAYRPIPLSDDPQYTSKDVTAVIPSLDGDGDGLRDTMLSCLRNDISKVIVVTIHANLERARLMAKQISSKIEVLSIEHPNKRNQLCRAIPGITTKITIFADDDVIWPSTALPWILAPFEDCKVGGVGTSQRLKREQNPNFWNFLGAAYLLRRNWDIISCNKMDGGLPCLSGRTVAYRTEIIQNDRFMSEFRNEKWKQYILKADDDNFLTRWLIDCGWKIRIQKHRECEIETTLEGNPKYLRQCMRWARSNWRSNLRSVSQSAIYRRHLWSTYAVFWTTLTSWSLFYDMGLAYSWWLITSTWETQSSLTVTVARTSMFLWIFLFCRLIKYAGHFRRYPSDLIYIPLIPLFGYFHCVVIKFWAACTLNVTAWGSREGADTTGSARMLPTQRESKSSFYSSSVDYVAAKSNQLLMEKPFLCSDTTALLMPT